MNKTIAESSFEESPLFQFSQLNSDENTSRLMGGCPQEVVDRIGVSLDFERQLVDELRDKSNAQMAFDLHTWEAVAAQISELDSPTPIRVGVTFCHVDSLDQLHDRPYSDDLGYCVSSAVLQETAGADDVVFIEVFVGIDPRKCQFASGATIEDIREDLRDQILSLNHYLLVQLFISCQVGVVEGRRTPELVEASEKRATELIDSDLMPPFILEPKLRAKGGESLASVVKFYS